MPLIPRGRDKRGAVVGCAEELGASGVGGGLVELKLSASVTCSSLDDSDESNIDSATRAPRGGGDRLGEGESLVSSVSSSLVQPSLSSLSLSSRFMTP